MTKSSAWSTLSRRCHMNDLERDRKHHRDKEIGRHNNRKYREALKVIGTLEKELEAYKTVSVAPSKRSIRKVRGNPRKAQATAVVVASDWHVDEIVKPSTVQGRNRYNPDIAQTRADKLFRKAVILTDRNRSDTTIDQCLLVLAGDFISGNIHEELLENTAMPPIDAIMYAQDLLDAGIRYLKEHGGFKQITVVCKSGNHSRITGKIRHATREGNSLEWAMYHNLAKRHPELSWIIEESYLTTIRVYDEVVRCHHGDAIKYAGGVGGLEVPMKRAYYQWNMTEAATVNIMGHYHSYVPGYNTVNGSLIGYNAYAAHNKFAYQPPIQAYILLDAARGITIHAPILV